MTEKEKAKAYEFNLTNRSYDIYAFAKDLLVWLEKQGEQTLSQTNEHAWQDGIKQYLNDSRVQEFVKKLCSKYVQKSTDKIEPKFKVGDWLCANELNNYANFIKIVNIVNVFGKKDIKFQEIMILI